MKVTYKFKFLVNDAQAVITSSRSNDIPEMKNRIIFLAGDHSEEEMFRDLALKFNSFISVSFSDGINATIYSNE